jgi:hypothetical protein
MQKLSLDSTSAPISQPQVENIGPSSSFEADRSSTQSVAASMASNGFNRGGNLAMKRPTPVMLGILLVFAIGAGVATGFGGYKLKNKVGAGGLIAEPTPLQQVAGDQVKDGQVFGVQDEKTFKDSAEGYLEDGGIGGEGSHKLLRIGGVSQTVVLTSSVTDLAKFTGMNVKVWGETFKAQKAGWLMDVGRVQVVSVKGQPPAED